MKDIKSVEWSNEKNHITVFFVDGPKKVFLSTMKREIYRKLEEQIKRLR